MLLIATFAFVCAALPCTLFCFNLSLYREPPDLAGTDAARLPAISVLIPARNEAHGIAEAVGSALASRGIGFEVVVMDDQSTDGTAAIVQELAAGDARVRLESSKSLPGGWNGKQYACWQLAQAARYPVLCFVDADVRLEPECLARMAALLLEGNNGLVSGFPRQVTETFLEWLLLPLIHFVLLGFLPLSRMRSSTSPSLAAGCGQFIMCNSQDYFAVGGHAGIQQTMHDGLRLPRLFRAHGKRTDLADLTHLARCRMYTSAGQVWSGLAKNATEGMAAPARIGVFTTILLLGQVWPFIFVPAAALAILMDALSGSRGAITNAGAALILAAACAAWLPRFLAVRRFSQDWRSAALHPLGITVLLMIQWYALARELLGRPVSWKSRAYVAPSRN